MESISQRLANYLVANGSIHEDDKDLYIFGIEQGLFIALNMATTFLVSLYFSMVWQGLLFLLCYFSLRSYSGGYHAGTSFRCYLVSTAITVLFFLLFALSFSWPPLIMPVLGVASAVVVLLLSPLESVNKPLDALEKTTYKKRSVVVLSFQIGAGLFLYALAQRSAANTIILSVAFVGAMLLLGKLSIRKYYQ